MKMSPLPVVLTQTTSLLVSWATAGAAKTSAPATEPTTNTKVAGHEDKVMPTPPDT